MPCYYASSHRKIVFSTSYFCNDFLCLPLPSPSQIISPSVPHYVHIFRGSPSAREALFKAHFRRSKAFEAMGNTASASWEMKLALGLMPFFPKLVDKPPPDAVDAFNRLPHMLHPSNVSLAQPLMDGSIMHAGRWTRHEAAIGRPPGSLLNFAAAHHAGKVYVVGGMLFQMKNLNPDVFCLDLATKQWRRVVAKGLPKGERPPQTEVYSSVVWRNQICILLFKTGSLYLFDMATET